MAYITVDDNKVVSIAYRLFCGEGVDEWMMEEATEEEPETFKVGNGEMLEKFEEQLIGLKKGDRFDIYVEPEDAHGPWDPNKVKTFPKARFLPEQDVDEDEFFEELEMEGVMFLDEDLDDAERPATVVEIGKHDVTLDFNHPLAGERLHFVGRVLNIKW